MRLLFLMLFLSTATYAQNSKFFKRKNLDTKFKVQFLSYVYHHDRNDPDFAHGYVEHFNNEYISIGYKITKKNYITVGTMNNSYGERCPIIGINREWHDFKYFTFVGGYGYVGSIFGTYSQCYNANLRFSDSALFSGWRPFIFHGINVPIYGNFSANIGFMLGGMYTAMFEYRF